MAEYTRFVVYEAPESYGNIQIDCALDIDNTVLACLPKPDFVMGERKVYLFCQITKHKDRLCFVVMQPHDEVKLMHLAEIKKRWDEWTNYPLSAVQDRLYQALIDGTVEPKYRGVYVSLGGLADFLSLYTADRFFRRKAGVIWKVLDAARQSA